MEHLPFDGWDHGPSKASDTMTIRELLMYGSNEEIRATLREYADWADGEER